MADAGRRLAMAFTGRFDIGALRACEGTAGVKPAPWHAADRLALHRLQSWCREGLPRGAPRLEGRDLSEFCQPDDAHHAERLAIALCLELDGTALLQACRGPVERLALRVRVKLDDAAVWRPPGPAAIWDSGFARTDEAALAAWARFRPRRPTLVVLAQASGEADRCLALLQAAQAAYDHPVRVLRLGGPGYIPA